MKEDSDKGSQNMILGEKLKVIHVTGRIKHDFRTKNLKLSM